MAGFINEDIMDTTGEAWYELDMSSQSNVDVIQDCMALFDIDSNAFDAPHKVSLDANDWQAPLYDRVLRAGIVLG